MTELLKIHRSLRENIPRYPTKKRAEVNLSVVRMKSNVDFKIKLFAQGVSLSTL